MSTHLRRALVILTAILLSCAVWVLAVPVAGVDLVVDQAGTVTTVGIAQVVLASLVAGLAGWGLLAVLERKTARGGRTWRIVAAAVLAVSFLGTLSAASTAATLVLLALHVVVGGTLLAGMVGRDASRSVA